MKITIYQRNVKVWLSANDTQKWASKPGACWPCSQLAGKRVFAEFDSNGLVDVSINGKESDVDANEFNALIADSLRHNLPKDHAAYFVTVEQFDRENSFRSAL